LVYVLPVIQQQPINMATHRCTFCNATEAAGCKICKSAAYCSEKCKKVNERLHNMLCDEFSKFTTKNPRPSDNAFLAIRLAPESGVPRLV
jgi:hypothetical protein